MPRQASALSRSRTLDIKTAVEFDAETAFRRDDEMIMQMQAQMLQRGVDTPGEFPVGKGGPERTAGVIVHEDERARLMLQHELNKFQRVQSHTVETAVAYFAIGKQSVLFV